MTISLSFSHLQSRRLHIGVCGSVAAYKALDVMRCLQRAGVSVSVTLTEAACRFVTPLAFEALGADPVYTGMFGQDEGILFGHLQPGRTVDALLVAPATAATLARMACGQADDMLSAQVLAFPGPVLVAPAMNPHMWSNQATRDNVALLESRGVTLIPPAGGVVACGDTGEGKLAPVDEIVFAAARALSPQDYEGATILITLGPTWEGWDGVRVWTNRSSGRMGAALAVAAALRGAKVFAVAGPGVPALPTCITRLDVESADQMFAESSRVWESCTHGIFTAAVADFKPVPHAGGKFKKRDSEGGLQIAMQPNADILASLGAKKGTRKVLGFAAETANLEDSVRAKLAAKGADLLAGNLVGAGSGGFGATENAMHILDKNGKTQDWPLLPKDEVAWRLLDWLSTL